ncbi:hypothetical protein M9H77_18486 [Catharanthus roseus]|uniref:Uncharacterized protein n=1 Tax=Catharanthus roseus TaxID=4058 RepID=A0ACC0B7W5_CATRO|nr:hypothetical protein M9H77_18486 [Catharanthus roseus]
MKNMFHYVYRCQLPTPHKEGISESPHSNLDPMRIIMQELQSMKREMGDIRRDITNLSIEKEAKVTLKGMSIPILKGFKAVINSMMVVDTLLLEVREDEV